MTYVPPHKRNASQSTPAPPPPPPPAPSLPSSSLSIPPSSYSKEVIPQNGKASRDVPSGRGRGSAWGRDPPPSRGGHSGASRGGGKSGKRGGGKAYDYERSNGWSQSEYPQSRSSYDQGGKGDYSRSYDYSPSNGRSQKTIIKHDNAPYYDDRPRDKGYDSTPTVKQTVQVDRYETPPTSDTFSKKEESYSVDDDSLDSVFVLYRVEGTQEHEGVPHTKYRCFCVQVGMQVITDDWANDSVGLEDGKGVAYSCSLLVPLDSNPKEDSRRMSLLGKFVHVSNGVFEVQNGDMVLIVKSLLPYNEWAALPPKKQPAMDKCTITKVFDKSYIIPYEPKSDHCVLKLHRSDLSDEATAFFSLAKEYRKYGWDMDDFMLHLYMLTPEELAAVQCNFTCPVGEKWKSRFKEEADEYLEWSGSQHIRQMATMVVPRAVNYWKGWGGSPHLIDGYVEDPWEVAVRDLVRHRRNKSLLGIKVAPSRANHHEVVEEDLLNGFKAVIHYYFLPMEKGIQLLQTDDNWEMIDVTNVEALSRSDLPPGLYQALQNWQSS